MENNDLNVLDELNKGATMGMDAIEFVVKKVGDEDFKITNTKTSQEEQTICTKNSHMKKSHMKQVQ